MPWRFVEMYDRIRFIDFVVSQALETNNRCLQGLANVTGEVPAVVLQKLFEDSRRLHAYWALVTPEVDQRGFKVADKRARRLTSMLQAGAQNRSAIASDLAGRASEDKTAQALTKLSRRLAALEAPLEPERLWVGFQEDSTAWRELDLSVIRDDAELVESGIGRWYVASKRLVKGLDAKSPAKLGQARVWHRQCCHTSHHLELIKPQLSEKGKATRWYIDKLARCLDGYLQLGALRKIAQDAELKRGAVERVQGFIDARRAKLWKRAVKLGSCAYADKRKVFVHDVRESVARLGLDQIVVLEPEPHDKRDLA